MSFRPRAPPSSLPPTPGNWSPKPQRRIDAVLTAGLVERARAKPALAPTLETTPEPDISSFVDDLDIDTEDIDKGFFGGLSKAAKGLSKAGRGASRLARRGAAKAGKAAKKRARKAAKAAKKRAKEARKKARRAKRDAASTAPRAPLPPPLDPRHALFESIHAVVQSHHIGAMSRHLVFERGDACRDLIDPIDHTVALLTHHAHWAQDQMAGGRLAHLPSSVLNTRALSA